MNLNIAELKAAFTLFSAAMSDRVGPSERLARLNQYFSELCRVAGIDPAQHPDLTAAGIVAADSIKGTLAMLAQSNQIECSSRYHSFVRDLVQIGANDPNRPMIRAEEFDGQLGVSRLKDRQEGVFTASSGRTLWFTWVPFSVLLSMKHPLLHHLAETDCPLEGNRSEPMIRIDGLHPVDFSIVVATAKRLRAEQVAAEQRWLAERQARDEADRAAAMERLQNDPAFQRQRLETEKRQLEDRVRQLEESQQASTRRPAAAKK